MLSDDVVMQSHVDVGGDGILSDLLKQGHKIRRVRVPDGLHGTRTFLPKMIVDCKQKICRLYHPIFSQSK